MRTRALFGGAVLLMAFFVFSAYSQNDVKPWEKYGLSQTEWKKISDNKISMRKLEELLSSGIDINDYIKKPWVALKLSESDWIEKRRAGMSNYDIELEAQTDRTMYKQDNKASLKAESNSISQNGALFRSLFLPGYEQSKMKQGTKGKVMSGLAIASLVGTAVLSINRNGFDEISAIPLIGILLPDMLWSMIDYKGTLRKLENE